MESVQMASFELLRRDWKNRLAALIQSAEEDLLIASPYISGKGAEFVSSHCPIGLKGTGRLVLLTDLSPMPICQGSTDPSAIKTLASSMATPLVYHLPKLHAKVYVADAKSAIITSGNLTAGGLTVNFEYGAHISDPSQVDRIRQDLMNYAELGAIV